VVVVRERDTKMSPRQVFGAMLRFYRTRARLSQEQLGALIHFSGDLVGKIENGQRSPTQEFTTACDAVAELATDGALGELRERLDSYFKQGVFPGWFHWPEHESRATTLRWYEPLLVPGLLQTHGYAQALFRTRVGVTDEQIEEMVAARMDRQAVLSRDRPPTLWVVLDEGVIRRQVGGPSVMAEQLSHLIDMMRRPNIVVQVIPVSIGAHEGLRGPFTIADFEDAPSIAWQDAAVFGQYVNDANGIGALMAVWDSLKSEALPRSASLALMEEAAEHGSEPH
jgi:transcriptional regulator with XRE-family HTH domain